ncbi:MAG TPA: hypothetical protein VFZ61_22350 [Polyangiales bacterium]
MGNLGVKKGLGLVALLGAGLLQASCDDGSNDDKEVADSSAQVDEDEPTDEDQDPGHDEEQPPAKDAGASKDAGSGSKEDASTAKPDAGGSLDATVDTGLDASVDGSTQDGGAGDAGSDAAAPDAGSGFATLPSVLSLVGCQDVGVPSLCSTTQNEGSISANCAGVVYTGTLTKERAVTLNAPQTTNAAGATVNLSCSGKLQLVGGLTLDCKQTVSAVGETAASEKSCALKSDPQILPGVSCQELPATLSNVVVCKEGAAAEGTTINAGTCKVIQDGCVFQAECANNTVLTGAVTRTGVTFTQKLKALADAATPATGAPAFLKGAEVNHNCTGTLSNGALTGSCVAGAVRGGQPTSSCTLEAAGTAVPTCENIAPATEQLFALESCDLLKNGEGQNPGIGEPVCAFRQNSCIWDVQCGNDPLTKFSGRLAPGVKKLEWRLLTGTPCEMSFDATGKMTGKCTVPGEAACPLSSKDAVAGGTNCPALPSGTDVKSNGCGGGDPLTCRLALQHGCNYMALCGFTARFPDLVVAGKTLYQQSRPRFEFNGLADYQCAVDKATEAEIASGDRAANEWYGQCTNAVGGQCRNNYNPETGTGYRGLRLYFDVPPATP